MTQMTLFGREPEKPSKQNNIPALDRFQGALLCSAIGDALGWPTEFLDPYGNRKPPFEVPLRSFVEWKKLVGGKWWGYEELIEPGAYSDDTQLALAVARCIAETGDFEPERFAYEELPLWLQYERGGGRSVKTAARKLIGKHTSWLDNFYKQGDLDYKQAGANGAAMRNLPIALVSVNNESRIIKDSFLNAIITHGHPRAILGAILFGLASNYALTQSNGITPASLTDYLRYHMKHIGKIVTQDDRISTWIHRWDNNSSAGSTFKQTFNAAHQEAVAFLEATPQHLQTDPQTYYAFAGALNPMTKGSGLATVCVAIYLFLKYLDSPIDALTTSVNTFGSDTDTIGVFLGALLGAYHGTQALPAHLSHQVQDHDYLLKVARRLHTIAVGERKETVAIHRTVDRKDAFFTILAWEIDLHEMFWDETGAGDVVFHPTLGRGLIQKKTEKPMKREGYVAKLISVQFDCGQSCVFHSRVENNEKVSESLAQEVFHALKE